MHRLPARKTHRRVIKNRSTTTRKVEVENAVYLSSTRVWAQGFGAVARGRNLATTSANMPMSTKGTCTGANVPRQRVFKLSAQEVSWKKCRDRLRGAVVTLGSTATGCESRNNILSLPTLSSRCTMHLDYTGTEAFLSRRKETVLPRYLLQSANRSFHLKIQSKTLSRRAN